MLRGVDNPRLGSDVQPFIVALMRAVRDGWEAPSNVSREEYRHIKDNRDLYPPCLVGFVGFACSFGGKWWGGYASNKENHNYAAAGSRVLRILGGDLQGASLVNRSYKDLVIPPDSLVYCDPPYKDTTASWGTGTWDSEEFWEWATELGRAGHSVWVSEYSAPFSFQLIWEKAVPKSLVLHDVGDRTVEGLYKYG